MVWFLFFKMHRHAHKIKICFMPRLKSGSQQALSLVLRGFTGPRWSQVAKEFVRDGATFRCQENVLSIEAGSFRHDTNQAKPSTTATILVCEFMDIPRHHVPMDIKRLRIFVGAPSLVDGDSEKGNNQSQRNRIAAHIRERLKCQKETLGEPFVA